MTKIRYSIAKQFSRHPGPRFRNQGPDSGEALRARLVRLLNDSHDIIEVDLDGTSGFGSSFLDEAFGGLIRHEKYDKSIIRRFSFISKTDPSYIVEIHESIDRAM
jgi:hypothetical protein